MPITKSAKKSLKVSRVKQAQNYKAKVKLDKALKNVDEKTVNKTVSTIDKSAKIGIIHKNKAARLKSALSKKFSTLKEAEKTVSKPASVKNEISPKGGKKTVVKKAVTKKAVAKSAKGEISPKGGKPAKK